MQTALLGDVVSDALIWLAVDAAFSDGDTRQIAEQLVLDLHRRAAEQVIGEDRDDRLVGLLRRTDPDRILLEPARAA
jgi:hypothetical protein